MPTGQREDLISVGGACDGDWWNVQQGEQTRQKHAMGCEISGRPSITVSNLWFNQSAMSSEARPACCAGVRLSHQPLAPKKQIRSTTVAAASKYWKARTTKEETQMASPKVMPPYASQPPGGAGHCFNQSEEEAPGNSSSGLMEGISLNSQTW